MFVGAVSEVADHVEVRRLFQGLVVTKFSLVPWRCGEFWKDTEHSRYGRKKRLQAQWTKKKKVWRFVASASQSLQSCSTMNCCWTAGSLSIGSKLHLSACLQGARSSRVLLETSCAIILHCKPHASINPTKETRRPQKLFLCVLDGPVVNLLPGPPSTLTSSHWVLPTCPTGHKLVYKIAH